MDKIRRWRKFGKSRILAENNGRRLVDQSYINPYNNQVVDFTLFDSSRTSVIIFPLTTSLEIIVARQFRPAIGQITLELPGGNIDPKDKELPVTAQRELLEETGYQADKLIQLPGRLWLDPSTCTPYVYSFLALDCKKIGMPKIDENEHLETVTLPLKFWMEMISSGKISDMKTVAITLLATSILKKRGR